jgi:catechol 2,3-dioxygenase-like lactoylglutathione lyase family enzyme
MAHDPETADPGAARVRAALAKAFYVDWLGFRVDWEHQTGPDGPRYLQVSRAPVVLHPFGNRLRFNQPLT